MCDSLDQDTFGRCWTSIPVPGFVLCFVFVLFYIHALRAFSAASLRSKGKIMTKTSYKDEPIIKYIQ